MGLSSVKPESVKVEIPEEVGYRVLPGIGVQFISRGKLDIQPTLMLVPEPILAAAYATVLLKQLKDAKVSVTIPEGMVAFPKPQRTA